MAKKRIGPLVTIKRSCFDCVYEDTEHYAVQSDTGCNVYCSHPSFEKPAYIADTRWDTPDWCPVLKGTKND